MFKDELKLVPHKPGSYQMIDKNGVIIYVGKAKDLNKRLHSYFRGTVTGKTALMVSEVDHFTYIVTKTEKESFILEINLIKKYAPKYNIMLRDDKTYPYIEYIKNPYPLLKVSRYTSIKKSDKKILFGPYPNAYAARRIVNLINRIYPLKKCDKMPNKVCLYYHIGECLGYCEKNIDNEKLESMESEILSFLKGNDKIIIDKINEKINKFSLELNFEKAKELKEELDYINIVLEKEKVELRDRLNRDVVSFYFLNGYLSIQIFFIRNGKLLGGNSNIVTCLSEVEDSIISYLYSFYENHEIPNEILISRGIDNKLLESLINSKVITPLKGDKKMLVEMCFENAKINLEREIDSFIQDEKRTFKANETLGKLLGIDNLKTIETFDNSNLFGSYCVSGMVVFKNGLPDKNSYRKYKMTLEKNDDYHMMMEVIYRRYYRLLIEKKDMPDLIIVDGGENQIRACKEVLNSLNLDIKVCGLKKDDHHKTRCLITDNKEVDLSMQDDVFNYLTRIQDEVHRFAITYHKNIRSKGFIASILDNVDGIGEKRKKDLLKKYGSIEKIKNASLEDLEKILPIKLSKDLKDYLSSIN